MKLQMRLFICKTLFLIGVLAFGTCFAMPAKHAEAAENVPDVSSSSIDFVGKSWKVKQVLGNPQASESFRGILFSAKGELNVASDCLYYVGKYKTDNIRSLLVTKLQQLADECGGRTKGDEVFLNAILMTDSFELANGDLSLFSGSDPVIKLEAVQLDNQQEFFKTQMKPRKGIANRKESNVKKHQSRAKANHKAAQKKASQKTTQGKAKKKPSKNLNRASS